MTPHDIVAAATLASKCDGSNKLFLVHNLATTPPMKEEPLDDVALMRRTFVAPTLYRACRETILSK